MQEPKALIDAFERIMGHVIYGVFNPLSSVFASDVDVLHTTSWGIASIQRDL